MSDVYEQCYPCQEGEHGDCWVAWTQTSEGILIDCGPDLAHPDAIACQCEHKRGWAIGDRVLVDPRASGDWTSGTVTAVDEEGRPRGVRVRMDRFVSGVDDCYASHAELKPEGDQRAMTESAVIDGRETMGVGGRCANSPSRGRHLQGGIDMADRTQPAIQERILRRIQESIGRDPRYRYFETPAGWQFQWTTERMGDGKFHAGVYRPEGAGSRSGKATTFVLVREAMRSQRKAAKATAVRWYLARLKIEAELVGPDALRHRVPEKARAALDRWERDGDA